MKKHFTFPSTDRITRIHGILWDDESRKPKAVIQLIHGMVEFIDRYDDFANYLVSQGFAVVGHDHLGHGQSVTDEEKLGYIAADNPGRVLVQDIHRLRLCMETKYEGLPYFMLGHSMGSYLLRRYLATQGDGLAGAIIMGSGYTKPRSSALGIQIARSFAKVFGWRHRSKLVTYMAFRKNLNYDTSGKDPARNWLSKDPESVRKYYSDPRCTYLFTLNGFKTLFETVSFVCHQENVDRVPKDLPVLIISGDDDPVGEGGRGVRKLGSMFWKAGIKDLKVKIFEGYRHEILNEIGKEQVYIYLKDWMEARAQK